MKRFFLPALAAISLLFAASATVRAQATDSKPDTMKSMKMDSMAAQAPAMMAGDHAPPPILQIETDDIKPYEQAAYGKIAAEYGPIAAKAKLPGWLALESLSGPPRAMYFFPNNTFEDIQIAEDMTMKNSAAIAQFNALDAREAAYVNELHNVIWHYRDDLSNNATGADLPHDRFWETITFHIKPGHDMEFEGLMKVVQSTYLKIGANIPWATFEAEMGASDTYLVLVPMKSLKEEDEGLARDKTFMDALGTEGMHKMDDVARNAYASVDDQLWEVNPKTSYPPPDWVSANPDFWTPKHAAPAAKSTMPAKPAAKPPAQ